jgi:hypothetical protein
MAAAAAAPPTCSEAMSNKDASYELGRFIGSLLVIPIQGFLIFLLAWPLWWGLLPLFPWLEMVRFGVAIASGSMILRFIFNRDDA